MRPNVTWICDQCARNLGAQWWEGHVATYHSDECGVCHEYVTVTEPRDFRWRSEDPQPSKGILR